MKTISPERVINAVKKYGNGYGKLWLPRELRTCNGWNALCNGVEYLGGELYVMTTITGSNTDADDWVLWSKFFQDGESVFQDGYRGWKYRYNQAQKQKFADNIAMYIEQLENGLGNKQKTIEKLLDWAGVINPIVNEYYRRYNLRWVRDGDDYRYKAYKGAENALIAHIKEQWAQLAKLSKEQLSTEYRKFYSQEFNRLLNA